LYDLAALCNTLGLTDGVKVRVKVKVKVKQSHYRLGGLQEVEAS
jgi:hypothetical protein